MSIQNCNYIVSGSGIIQLDCPTSILYQNNTNTGIVMLAGFQDNSGNYYIDKSMLYSSISWFWFIFFCSVGFFYLLLKSFKLGYGKQK